MLGKSERIIEDLKQVLSGCDSAKINSPFPIYSFIIYIPLTRMSAAETALNNPLLHILVRTLPSTSCDGLFNFPVSFNLGAGLAIVHFEVEILCGHRLLNPAILDHVL